MKRVTANQKFSWLPAPPVDMNEPYYLGNYDFSRISTAIAPKYLNRKINLKRAWSRICTHFPETTNTDEKYKILEFSTAHGAMLEIWQALGHTAEGTDYCFPPEYNTRYKPINGPGNLFDTEHTNPVEPKIEGWIYQPVIESIGGTVHLFDAGQLPYAFEDNAFDFVCCYQAIEAYAKPADWGEIVAEFCRIAKRAVVIGFNPPPIRSELDEGWDATKEAWEKLRTYDENGFRNQFFEIEESGRAFHPSACKLVATDC